MNNNEKKRFRYTVSLSEDLHSWLAERADGTPIASAIVVLLNCMRLEERDKTHGSKERVEEQ